MTHEKLVESCIRAGFQEGLNIVDPGISWDEFLSLKNDSSKDGHSEAHSTYQIMEAIAREAVKITGEALLDHAGIHDPIVGGPSVPSKAIKSLTQGTKT